jgi:hypothetical protein
MMTKFDRLHIRGEKLIGWEKYDTLDAAVKN